MKISGIIAIILVIAIAGAGAYITYDNFYGKKVTLKFINEKLENKGNIDMDSRVMKDLVGDRDKTAVDITPSTDTICKNGVCNTVIYSGIRYVEEDGKWKYVEDARSLKGKGFGIWFKETDKDISLEILDFNLTTITYKVSSEKYFDIPLKIYEIENSTSKNIVASNNLMSSKTKEAYILQDSLLGKEIHFGEASTIIILNESNNGNVGDCGPLGNSGDTVRCSQATNDLQDWVNGVFERLFFKWNLSSIPVGSTILNANMSLYITATSVSVPYTLYNTTSSWTETNLTWNNQPSASATIGAGTISNGYSGWLYFNVTNASISTFNLNPTKNMSLAFKTPEEGIQRYATFTQKEYTTDITKRPQLEITYEAPSGDTTPPTYTNFNASVLNNTGVSSGAEITYYALWYDNNQSSQAANSSKYGTGNWANGTWANWGTGNWTNYTVYPTLGNGENYTVRIYANDSMNNMNVTGTLFWYENIAPTIAISSPTNTSYLTTTVWTNVTLDEKGSMCIMSLDGSANVTMTNSSGNYNNITSSISLGNHNVKVYCNDTYGNMGTATQYFSVATPLITKQWIGVTWYNGTYINLTLYTWVYNNYTSTVTNIGVGVMQNYTNYTIGSLNSGSDYLNIETKQWVRYPSVDLWFNFTGVQLSGNGRGNSTDIPFIIPVDPATKGVVNCYIITANAVYIPVNCEYVVGLNENEGI